MNSWSGNSAVIALRSSAFHIASALATLIFLPLYALILAPKPVFWRALRLYLRTQLWLLKVICGQSYCIVGRENLPDGPCIIAARHEAMWETLVLPVLLDNPAVMLKDDILRYPLAGPIARKLGYIGVDRAGSLQATKKTFETAGQRAKNGQSLLIFPNGTRDPHHRYRVQSGVAVLYRTLALPCVPVVLNSGTFWPYKSWQRVPGVITVRLLPAIDIGERTGAFLERLQQDLAQPA